MLHFFGMLAASQVDFSDKKPFAFQVSHANCRTYYFSADSKVRPQACIPLFITIVWNRGGVCLLEAGFGALVGWLIGWSVGWLVG